LKQPGNPLGFGDGVLTALTLFAHFAYRVIPPRKSISDHCVALVAGGAILGFDGYVHIDLDRSHTVLSPDEARRVAIELKKIADAIDPRSPGG
jgi:hypothetical protein